MAKTSTKNNVYIILYMPGKWMSPSLDLAFLIVVVIFLYGGFYRSFSGFNDINNSAKNRIWRIQSASSSQNYGRL